MHRRVRYLLAAIAAVVALAGPAAAQDMTAGDITRLQQTADQISADLAQFRTRDRTAARTMQSELSDLEDEIVYLKVKMRKERSVARYEYNDLNNRLMNLRSRVRGESTGNYGSGTTTEVENTTAPGTLPVGTELDVRLTTRLDSDTAQVEDRFEATTLVDVRQNGPNGRVMIPAGSVVRGVVTDVDDAGRLERKGRLVLSFDQIRVNGRVYPIRGTVIDTIEAGGYKEDAEKIGAGAAVGAILGGILGGVKGAITGILIGGGGVVAATEGQDVVLPEGSVLRMRLDQALTVRQNLTRR